MPRSDAQDQFNLMYRFVPYDVDAVSEEIDACAYDHIPRMVVGDHGVIVAVVIVENGMVMLYTDSDLLMESMEQRFDG